MSIHEFHFVQVKYNQQNIHTGHGLSQIKVKYKFTYLILLLLCHQGPEHMPQMHHSL
jgi:hypothetical protein